MFSTEFLPYSWMFLSKKYSLGFVDSPKVFWDIIPPPFFKDRICFLKGVVFNKRYKVHIFKELFHRTQFNFFCEPSFAT